MGCRGPTGPDTFGCRATAADGGRANCGGRMRFMRVLTPATAARARRPRPARPVPGLPVRGHADGHPAVCGVTGADDAGVVLSPRRKRAAPAAGRTAAGLTGVAAVAAVFILEVYLGYGPRHGVLAAVVGLTAAAVFCYSGWLLVDGGTDLVVWFRLNRGPGRAMRLSRRGVEYSEQFRGRFDVSVPWPDVERCEFRPGFGGTPIFCVDAPGRFPSPPAHTGATPRMDPHVDPVAATAQALRWVSAIAPEPLSPVERSMLVNLYLFGTPIVINLAQCDGARIPELDRLIRSWTRGRCRCVPPEAATVPLAEHAARRDDGH